MKFNRHYATTAYDSRIPYTAVEPSKERWLPHKDNGRLMGRSMAHNTHLSSSSMGTGELRSLHRVASKASFYEKSPLHNLTTDQIPAGLSLMNHDHVVFERGYNTLMTIFIILLEFPARLIFYLQPAMYVLCYNTKSQIITLLDAIILSICSLGVIGAISLARIFWRYLEGDKRRAYAIFFRSTGMVYYFPVRKGPPVVKPFTEYDGVLLRIPAPQGSAAGSSYGLHISHKQDGRLHFSLPSKGESVLEQEIYWSWLCQFMDTSKPLPDTPEFEAFRHLDPVTDRYDQDHARPADFYRDMSDETLIKLYDKSLEARRPLLLYPRINSIYDLPDDVEYLPYDSNDKEAKRTINNRNEIKLTLKNYPKYQLFIISAALIFRGLAGL